MTPEKNNGGYYTVRVRFSKVGSLQYISHLDLIRTLTKVMIRTRLPIWFTEGFNPKPKISYTAPLSIGVESVCEYMDIRLVDYVEPNVIREALNGNLTDEMQVQKVYYAETKLNTLTWIAYEIRIHTAGADEKLASACESVLSAPSIIVLKHGKAGDHETDIRPAIRSVNVAFREGDLCLSCVLRSDSTAFLNPEHLIRVLKEKCGILSDPDLTKEWYSVLRTEAYAENMEVFR